MSYKIINDGRSRAAAAFTPNNAIAATQFRKDREEAEMPVATPDQLKRARRLVEQNPMIRARFFSPLGLEQLALELPLSRKERAKNRLGKDDGGIGLTLEPRIVRTGDAAEFEANADAVEGFVDANPHMDEADAAHAIAGMSGYTDLRPSALRADRYTRGRSHRVWGALRARLGMLSAAAQAALLIRERHAAANMIGQLAVAVAS